MSYTLVYHYQRDSRILSLIPTLKSRWDVLSAKERVKPTSFRKFKYTPSEKYLNFIKKFKNENNGNAY